MSDDHYAGPSESAVWVGGKRLRKLAEHEPDVRQPSEKRQQEALRERREDVEAGNVPLENLTDYIHDDDNEPRDGFASERDAAEHYEKQKQESAETANLDRQIEAEQAEREARQEIESRAQWSPQEQQVLDHIGQRVQTYEAGAAMYNDLVKKLDAANAWTPQLRAQAAEARQRMEAERAQLEPAIVATQRAVQLKGVARDQAELFHEIPDLKDKKTKAAFVDWAVDEKKLLTRTQANTIGAAHVHLIKQAWAQFQKERNEQKAAARHAERAEWSRRNWPGSRADGLTQIEPPASSKSAKERLRKTGSMRDALGAITLARMERTGG